MRTDHFVENAFVSTSSVTAVTPSPVSGKVGVRPLPIRHPKRKDYPYKLKFIFLSFSIKEIPKGLVDTAAADIKLLQLLEQ